MKTNFSILFVFVLALSGLLTGNALPSAAQERGVKKFGVYEVTLSGDGSVANPFDTMATVSFTPPSGQAKAKTVYAFYDGDNIWRARVYVSETGAWRWSSACATDKGLGGKTGAFKAVDSKLRGRLLPHLRNPRHWITEDGQWFLNLSDTAYYLLCKFDGNGQPIPFGDFAAYVRDAVAQGITSVRSIPVSGPKSHDRSGNLRWDAIFADAGLTGFRVDNFQETDRRLQWLLDNYPDLYVFTNQLTGLDSVRFIRDYFTRRTIELSDFEPDHRLASDPDQRPVAQHLKLMRRGTDEYLIYHPNAAAEGRETKPDTARRARLRLDLREAQGRFTVEWYRAEDGVAQKGGAIEGGREIELVSPWVGHDVVVRLRR